MSAAQMEDDLILPADTSIKLQTLSLPDSTVPLICDISTGRVRPFVPSAFQKQVFRTLHSLSHPGIRGSQKLLSSRFFWPNMHTDISFWARSCIACQKTKVHRHTKPPLGSFPLPSCRFDRLHLDLCGLLPPSRGCTYLLTMVDRYTRWPEVIPLSSPTAENIATAFLTTWVARFGVPSSIVTDNGPQFRSHLWRDFLSLLGIEKIHSSTYHPQGNSYVERLHRQLKAALRCAPNPQHWVENLPLVLLGLRLRKI